MRGLHQRMQGRARLNFWLTENMNCRPLHQTRFGLAWVAVLVTATLFRLAMPTFVATDALKISICSAIGKPVNQKSDPQSDGQTHSHGDSCDYCVFDLDNLAGLPPAVIPFAFSQTLSIKLYPIVLSDDLRVSWTTPYSRAPPSITV